MYDRLINYSGFVSVILPDKSEIIDNVFNLQIYPFKSFIELDWNNSISKFCLPSYIYKGTIFNLSFIYNNKKYLIKNVSLEKLKFLYGLKREIYTLRHDNIIYSKC